MFRKKMEKSIETIQKKAEQIYFKFKSYFAYQVGHTLPILFTPFYRNSLEINIYKLIWALLQWN